MLNFELLIEMWKLGNRWLIMCDVFDEETIIFDVLIAEKEEENSCFNDFCWNWKWRKKILPFILVSLRQSEWISVFRNKISNLLKCSFWFEAKFMMASSAVITQKKIVWLKFVSSLFSLWIYSNWRFSLENSDDSKLHDQSIWSID